MEEFDLKRFAKLAMAKKVYIIVIMIISIILGIFYTFVCVTPKYKSSTTLLFAQINEEKNNENTVKQSEITDLSMTSTLLEPYISIIESNRVLKQVINNLNLDMTENALRKILSVTEENTAMVAITVINEDSELAEKIANEIAGVFTNQSEEIFNITNVNIIDKAEKAVNPYNVNHAKDLAIFLMLGIFASCGLILVLYMLDTSIKEPEDIENELNLPVLGLIPAFNQEIEYKTDVGKNRKGYKETSGKVNELVIMENAKSPVSEAFRILRTNVTFAQNTKSILVTSSKMSEGKSYVTANLATAIAKTGKKVIVVDADMRKGRQHKIFDVENKEGLSNYLANSINENVDINELAGYIKTTDIPNLHMLTCGTRPTNPAELLVPNKVKNLITILTEIYDIVILDGTPSNIIADSITISKFVDYSIFVTSYKTTKLEEAKRLIKSFEQVGVKLSGVVLNKYPFSKSKYQSSYYYSEPGKAEFNLEENNQNEIKSVESFVSEANFKTSKQEIVEPERYNDDSKEFITSNNSLSEYKIEKIDSELSAMKNLIVQMAMNSNQISSKDIELIRYDISSLKNALNSSNETTEIKELKEELDSIKRVTEELLKMQKESSNRKNYDRNNYDTNNYYRKDNRHQN